MHVAPGTQDSLSDCQATCVHGPLSSSRYPHTDSTPTFLQNRYEVICIILKLDILYSDGSLDFRLVAETHGRITEQAIRYFDTNGRRRKHVKGIRLSFQKLTKCLDCCDLYVWDIWG